MKRYFFILLFELLSMVCVFSQINLQEFDIEKDENPPAQIFYKNKGCTPDVGVIVFYTTISDLKFSMPDTPNRLKNVSAFDKENNCYVLCIQPTDTRIGGISQYSIDITGAGYKPNLVSVNGINAGVAQYYKINQKEDLSSKVEYLMKELEALKRKNNAVASSNEQKPETSVAPVTPTNPVYSAMSWYQEGLKNSNTGNYSEAIQCYLNALNMNPNMSDAWYNLGIAYEREKKNPEALGCYQKAAQFGNKDAQLLLTGYKDTQKPEIKRMQQVASPNDQNPVSINKEEVNGRELNFVFKGIENNTNFSVKLFLNNKFIGEASFEKGFQFKYIDSNPGTHDLTALWTKHKWEGKINTNKQTEFIFEYKKKKTGFGYDTYFGLIK